MENMVVKVNGDTMTIEVDLTKEVGSTGRGNKVVATTGNWTKVEGHDGVSMNLIVVKKEKK